MDGVFDYLCPIEVQEKISLSENNISVQDQNQYQNQEKKKILTAPPRSYFSSQERIDSFKKEENFNHSSNGVNKT